MLGEKPNVACIPQAFHNFLRMPKILCIEDAEDSVVMLQSTFRSSELTVASTIREASELLRSRSFDLIILDIDLPDGSGLELLSDLSSETEVPPVILLTGKTDFTAKATAFSLGAEDFVVKPFDPRELKLRVDARIRKTARVRQEQGNFQIGELICNVAEQRLYPKDRRGSDRDITPALTASEFKIFALLAKTPNKVFTRAEILDRIWGDDLHVSGRSVDVHVSNMRKKVNPLGVDVEAVVGVGYRVTFPIGEGSL